MAIGAVTGLVSAGSSLYNEVSGWFGGSSADPLPPPLNVSLQELSAALQQNPGIAVQIKGLIRRQGHTHLYIGNTSLDRWLSDPLKFAELTLWFANGTGDDLSSDEKTIRQLTEQALGSYQPSTTQAGGFTGSLSDFFGAVQDFGSEGQAAVQGAQAGVAADRASRSSFGGILPLIAVGAVAFFIARA